MIVSSVMKDITRLVYSNFSAKIMSQVLKRTFTHYRFVLCKNLNKLSKKLSILSQVNKNTHSDKKYVFVTHNRLIMNWYALHHVVSSLLLLAFVTSGVFIIRR